MNDDPRGLRGQLARGSNIYMGASKSPYAGKITMGKQFPEYKKLSLKDVARKALSGSDK